jgi:hypothetical protein
VAAIYYQVPNPSADGYIITVFRNSVTSPTAILYGAEYVWLENETGVRFLKNRHRAVNGDNNLLTEEELKYFRWIKLSAVEYEPRQIRFL